MNFSLIPVIFILLCRFDSQGGLNFEFSPGLIDPSGSDLIEAPPKGAHFLLRGAIGFPLAKKVKGGANKELGEVGIKGSFGFYSELQVNGKTTADVVKVISEQTHE